MSNEERLQKRRERWRKNKSAAKEDQLMIDYVRHKYAAVYEEAALVCKHAVKKYPEKKDLRKTHEHKIWLSNDSTMIHPILNSTLPSTSTLAEYQRLTIIARPQTPTTIPNPQTTTTNLPNPEPSSPELSIPEPRTPELSVPEPRTPELSVPEPRTPELSVPEPPIHELSVPEPPSPKTPIPPNSKGKKSYTDNMQLIIPLLKSPVKQSGVITETLETVTEEIIEGDKHQVLEQLDPQTMETISH